MSTEDKALQKSESWAVGEAMDFNDQGVELKNFEDLWRFAQLVKRSGMVPDNASVDTIMISVQKGRELGFPAMQSVHAIPVVKGRPTLEGKAMLALIQANDVDDHRGPIDCGCSGEGDDRIGWCESWRKGWPKPRRTEFSWTQAVTAGLTKPRGRQGAPSIYMTYGEDMLQWKAVSRHTNKYYSDITHGLMLQLTAQEVYETARDVTPQTVAALPLEPAPADPLLSIAAPAEEIEAEVVEPVTEEPAEPGVCRPLGDYACYQPKGHEGDCDPGGCMAPIPEKAKPETTEDRADAFAEGCLEQDREAIAAEPEKESIQACGRELENGERCYAERGHNWDCDTGEVFPDEPAEEAVGPCGNTFGDEVCMMEPDHKGPCDWVEDD